MTQGLPDQDFDVRRAKPADLPYLEKLQRRFSNQIGFFPRSWMAEKLDQGRYLLLAIRGQPAAFSCLSGGIRAPVRVLQHAVDEQLWRQGYGQLLFSAVANYAARTLFPTITLQVRASLVANHFWKALGGQLTGVRVRPTARRQPLNCYTFSENQVSSVSASLEGPDCLPDPRFQLSKE